MQLVARTPPTGVLEPAPVTSLCEATEFRAPVGQWEGFWDGDHYCVRGREAGGREMWFEIAGEPAEASGIDASPRAPELTLAYTPGSEHAALPRERRVSYAVWAVSHRRRARGKRASSALACLFAIRRPPGG